MEIKCEFCGNLIEDTAAKCPNCGAPNNNMARTARKIPQTIEELQAFCRARKLNPEKLHFHIGEDYKEPKAFGIFQDTDGSFVVYKNKADGTRAVRYRGADEAYAVNELYQKLKAEVLEIRAHRSSPPSAVTRSGSGSGRSTPAVRSNSGNLRFGGKRKWKIGCLGWFIIILIGVPVVLAIFSLLLTELGIVKPSPADGYYTYNDSTYYHNSSGWYEYDDDSWYPADVDDDLLDNFGDYYEDSYSGYTFTRPDDYDYGGYEYDYEYDNNWDDDWDDDDWSWDWGNDDDWDSGWDNDWDDDWGDWDSDW